MGRISSKALTAKQVENEVTVGYHADGSNTGLYLQVTSNGQGVTRSWVYRYTSPTTRKRRELGLGSTRVRKLADARSLCSEFRLKVLNGLDPKDERDQKKAVAVAARAHQITFDEAISRNLQVMDATAFALCRDQKLPIKVFSIFKPGALKRVVLGEDEGTLVHV